MVTDTRTNNLRIVLHQIYVGLYIEYGEQLLQFLPLGTKTAGNDLNIHALASF